MDYQSQVNWMLGISEGRASCRRARTPDITEIASNLDHTNRLDLQQSIVNADGDSDDPFDRSGIPVAINAMTAPKLSESGLTGKTKDDGRDFEPGGNPNREKQDGDDSKADGIARELDSKDDDVPSDGDPETKALDAKVKAVRTAFEKKHGSEARMMLRAHVRKDGNWSESEEPLRKAISEMCENDAAWDSKRAAHARMGGAVQGYDNTSKCYG